MKITSTQKFILLAITALLIALVTVRAASEHPADLIERGRYLVNDVALCADCHSPRDEKGQFIRSLWLKGAALPFQPTVEMPWSPAAPPIAGLPSMTDAQAIEFFTQGKRPDGSRARPPMPQLQLTEADAQAVTAYLRSLAE